ncbi:MAG: hypothetical protein HY721_19220 [Planctomycetes bacterium]|nr:hypothetical protein [Planctomycetota bacterium]
MMRFLVKSLKYGAIVLVTAAAACAVFGRCRVQELLRYVKSAAAENLDGMIPDEVKLRNDMERLREEYPRRIAELKALVDELERQLGEVEQDRQLCREVLVLCDEDLGQLRPKVESPDPAVPAYAVKVELRGATFTYSEALERSRKILDLKAMYGARLEAAAGSLELLQSERERLAAELAQLHREYDQFLAEYRSLEREIDLLKSNALLIEIAGRRDRLGRADTSGWLRSLDAVRRAIDKRKTEQAERLRAFKVGNPAVEYETRARVRNV